MNTETTMQELFEAIRNTDSLEDKKRILEDIRRLIEDDVEHYYLTHKRVA